MAGSVCRRQPADQLLFRAVRAFGWLLVVALSVAQLGVNAKTSSVASGSTVSLRGRLVYKELHGRGEHWTLATSLGGPVYKLPGQPLDSEGNAIVAGNIVSLVCTPLPDDDNVCGTVTSAAVTRAAAPLLATGMDLKLLVMVMSLNGACTVTGATVPDVEAAFRREYMDYLRNCSYGQMQLDPTAFKVISTPVTCSARILRCDEDAMAKAAFKEATRQLGAAAVQTYTHYTYVIPGGMAKKCGWVGLAELPGYQTWYTPDNYGVFRKGTVMQELLHNFGIFHGWKDGVEYMDYSTAMGQGNSCPSAPELWRLGWATPIDTLNSANLPAQVFKSYVLPATSTGPNEVMLKIQPDWLNWQYSKNMYLGLRHTMAGDENLLPTFEGKVNVHELAKNIDNSFRASGDPRVSIIGIVDRNSFCDFPNYKLYVVTGDRAPDNTTINVRVCRYLARPTECQDSAHPSSQSGSPSPSSSLSPVPAPRGRPRKSSPPPRPPPRPPPPPKTGRGRKSPPPPLLEDYMPPPPMEYV